MAEPPPFDPYASLHTLDRNRVAYIMIGAFAPHSRADRLAASP